MRRGLLLVSLVLLVAALGAAVAHADGGTGTTTTGTTDTTTTGTTTTTTTTTPTTTTSGPTYTALYASRLPHGCVGAGVAAIVTSRGATGFLALPQAGLGASEYPGSHPFLTFDSAAASGSGCSGSGVTVTNVSLFSGAVTAAKVNAADGRGNVVRLAVYGSAVSLATGQTAAVGNWGLLTRGAKDGRLSAPFALRLAHSHDSVPAGTTIYIGFTAAPAPPATGKHPKPSPGRHRHHHPQKQPHTPTVAQPLSATPGLGFAASHYVFPVDGGASYIDTYGAGRNDIYDGWHHGDDLFAPLGTPLVAVADGTLTLVGWNELGGWRLWLTDAKGNSFYYAHLAGYSRAILHHHNVKAGQVIGFLGRTGDAFTTPPHLHFEIHPHQFVRLGYDGAVNPTSYLQSWMIENLPASQIPAATRLQAPAGTPTQEAVTVWKELLSARHLTPDGEPVVARTPSVRRPFPATQGVEAFIDTRRLSSSRLAGDALPTPSNQWLSVALGLTLAALMAGGSFAVLRRRRTS
jgi:hypothetical protein